MSDFFDIFRSVENDIIGKNPKFQFLSFPIISSSNEPRGGDSHWGMNTSGIGQCDIFFEFLLSVRNEFYGKKPIKSIFEFSNYI